MTLGIARINDSNRAVEILPTNEHMNITYVCFSTEDDKLLNRLNSCGLRGKSYILNHNKWIYIYVYVLITWIIIIISVNYGNLIDYPLRCSYDWKTPERKREKTENQSHVTWWVDLGNYSFSLLLPNTGNYCLFIMSAS